MSQLLAPAVESDTVVLDGALDKLLAFGRRRSSAGICDDRTVYPDGSLNPHSYWRMTIWSLLCRASRLTAIFPHSACFNAETYGTGHGTAIEKEDIVAAVAHPPSLWVASGGWSNIRDVRRRS
jgi:hypothetical protein